jgi:hypothetical protein
MLNGGFRCDIMVCYSDSFAARGSAANADSTPNQTRLEGDSHTARDYFLKSQSDRRQGTLVRLNLTELIAD